MKKSFIHLVTAGILLMALSMNCRSQDWPQWRGIGRDDKVEGFAAPAKWPGQLKMKWTVQVGVGDATPALVNNRLYVFTRQGESEILHCLDAITGKLIWASEAYPAIAATGPAASHPGPRSSPSVYDGKIVTTGIGGDIACHDASTGKLIWRNEDFRGAVPKFYTGMSPLVSSGICLAHLGGPETGYFMAFDLATGSVRWKTAGEGPAYGSPVLLTSDGLKQVVFQSLTKLAGLDVETGAILWEYPTPVGEGRVNNAASPVADGARIYFTGMNNGVNALEIKKQGDRIITTKLWTNPDFSTSYNTPVIKDGYLYGLSNKGRLFCLRTDNGKTEWSDDTPQQNFGSVIDAGSVMIALSSNSNLVVSKPDSREYVQLALIKISDSPVYAHPVLSGNRIYIKNADSVILYTTE